MLLTQLNDWSSSIGRSFLYIFILIAVMAIAFYVTKYLSAKSRGYTSGNLKIIEGLSVGQHSSVLLIKAGEKFMLIGVTKENVNYLSEIDGTDLESSSVTPPGRVFESYLNNFLKGRKDER